MIFVRHTGVAGTVGMEEMVTNVNCDNDEKEEEEKEEKI